MSNFIIWLRFSYLQRCACNKVSTEISRQRDLSFSYVIDLICDVMPRLKIWGSLISPMCQLRFYVTNQINHSAYKRGLILFIIILNYCSIYLYSGDHFGQGLLFWKVFLIESLRFLGEKMFWDLLEKFKIKFLLTFFGNLSLTKKVSSDFILFP